MLSAKTAVVIVLRKYLCALLTTFENAKLNSQYTADECDAARVCRTHVSHLTLPWPSLYFEAKGHPWALKLTNKALVTLKRRVYPGFLLAQRLTVYLDRYRPASLSLIEPPNARHN